MKKVMSESTYENKLRPMYYENNYANMAAAFIVETEKWNLASQLFSETKAAPATAEQSTMGGGAHGGHTSRGRKRKLRRNAAHFNGKRDVADFYSRISCGRKRFGQRCRSKRRLKPIASSRRIGELEVAALNASMKKDHAKAIELMKKATAIEEQSSPPYGPPNLIKPSHELFGEILLRAGKPAEAAEQFKTALLRQPNRARSLLGSARAAAQNGNQAGALIAYARLIEQWKQADD